MCPLWCPYCFRVLFKRLTLLSFLSSDMYRTIKLFLVGRMGRGKSTLLRKLCPTGQTVGSAIDLGRFTYAPVRQTSVRETITHLGRNRQAQKKPAKFLVWDFAGQVYTMYIYYHIMYMCVHVCMHLELD